MSTGISPETEARLTDEARKQGVSVEALLDLLLAGRRASAAAAFLPPELPVWNLGGAGALHRRDVYDGVSPNLQP